MRSSTIPCAAPRIFGFSLSVLAVMFLAACAQVDGTGRNQLLFTSAGEENRQGAEAYRQILATEKRCTDPATVAYVERVGKRIQAVVDGEGKSGFQWEFTVLESPTANAFCLPGGKVAVYTGILPLCANEAGLAAVMGHEIAHAIARHGGERMSQQMVTNVGSSALLIALEQKGVEANKANMMLGLAGGLAKLGVLLPYSRVHELEADRLGLRYMARAGYDPAQAVAFWQRFAAFGDGTPSFLSTHPASSERANALAQQQEEAQPLYHAAAQQSGSGAPVPPCVPAAK